MQFPPNFYHSIPLRSKYFPQHPVLKHPQSVFLPKTFIIIIIIIIAVIISILINLLLNSFSILLHSALL
jgi:hypothetical protein